MKKTWTEQIAKENAELLNEYGRASFKYMTTAKKLQDARHGKMISRAEELQVAMFNTSPLSLGIGGAILETADALTLSGKPTPQVAPLIFPGGEQNQMNEYSQKVAEIFRFNIQKDWYDSLGSLQFDRIIQDNSTIGRGLAYIRPSYDAGEFGVQVTRGSWRYYFPDPNANNLYYDDSENQIYAYPVTKKQALKMLKEIEPDITQKEFDEDFATGSHCADLINFFEDSKFYFNALPRGSQKLVVCHRFTLEENTLYTLVPKKMNIKQDIRSYQYKMYDEESLTSLNLDKNLVNTEPYTKYFLTEYFSIGNRGYKKVFPVKNYNLIPFNYDHDDTPFPYGRMWYLYPLNRAFNKFIISAIINASLLNAVRVVAEEDSIIDINEWTLTSSLPGAILRYKLPYPGVSKPPEIVDAKPMNDAWLTFPRFIIQLAEYISGIFGIMMGDASKSPDVFSSIAALQSSGNTKIKRRLTHADAFLAKIGMSMAEFYTQYAPPNGFGSMYNFDEGKSESVEYNQLEILNQEKKEPGKKQSFEVDVRIKPDTDLSMGVRNVRFTSQGSAGHEAATQALALTTLATQLGIPDLAPDIVKLMGVGNAREIAERIDKRKELESTVQNQEKMIKELDGRGKILENNIFQMARTIEQARAKGKEGTILATLQTEVKNILEKLPK